MDSQVEEIKKRIDIVDFLGNFIPLKKAGRNFKANCPFHQEKTPSFVVSPERQIWHCFGACGEGGDVIRFLMKWEKITFYEALRDLAKKTGVKLKSTAFEDNTFKKKEKLLEINYLATQYYLYVLEKTKFGKKAIEYLQNRGINSKIVKKFQLGYAPSSWQSLISFLLKKHYDIRDILETGLVIKGKTDYYDRFRGRIIFPIKNPRAEVIGFSGRTVDPKIEEAKYINTPETLLYHKRETLYGIDLARDAIKKAGSVLLVEGEFDMISPYQAGVGNIVAIKGSAVTKDQLLLLKRYTSRINLFLDADKAGEEAAKRSIREIEDLDLEAGVIKIDFAKDPDEAVRADSVKFKQAIEKPLPIYDFLLLYLQKKYSVSEAFGKKKIGDEMAAYLINIKNPIVQAHYIKKLAKLLEVEAEAINSLLRKLKYKSKIRETFRVHQEKDHEIERYLVLQKYLLSYIFQNETPYKIYDQAAKVIENEDFSIPAHQKIWQSISNFKQLKPKNFDLNKFSTNLSVPIQPVFDEVYLFASHDPSFVTQNIDRLIYELKKLSIKKRLTELLSYEDDIKQERKVTIKRLNQELNQVEKKLVLL